MAALSATRMESHQALVALYRRMGFEIFGRSPLDDRETLLLKYVFILNLLKFQNFIFS